MKVVKMLYGEVLLFAADQLVSEHLADGYTPTYPHRLARPHVGRARQWYDQHRRAVRGATACALFLTGVVVFHSEHSSAVGEWIGALLVMSSLAVFAAIPGSPRFGDDRYVFLSRKSRVLGECLAHALQVATRDDSPTAKALVSPLRAAERQFLVEIARFEDAMLKHETASRDPFRVPAFASVDTTHSAAAYEGVSQEAFTAARRLAVAATAAAWVIEVGATLPVPADDSDPAECLESLARAARRAV